MNSLVIAGLAFICAFGGALLGMALRRAIPAAHLNRESKDGVQIGTALIATLAALVLGLLIGGAKASFDTERTGLQELATNIVLLDRTLAHYGPETQTARDDLHQVANSIIARLRLTGTGPEAGLADNAITTQLGNVFRAIQNLNPADPRHQGAQAHALELTSDLSRARWRLTQRDDDVLPMAFLIVLLFWFFVLFASLGAFWARNLTVAVVLLVCAMTVASSLFLIVDLSQPFQGVIQVSCQPLDDALVQIGK